MVARVFTLTDGTRIAVRPVLPSDKTLLADGLRHLSRESVERRFLGPKPRFSSAELRYLTEIDGRDHVAFVALAADDPSALAGIGRFVRLSGDRETADVAVVVGDCHQGKRLGTLLGRLLAEAARERGIRRFSATMRANNLPAHRLFESISGHLVEGSEGFGVHDVVGDLAA